ncbi:MAG: hypothetical protein MK081_08490 [Flavobacteriales bacterium]|nr:hypothetical protein [Flavobacteriales bacterium]
MAVIESKKVELTSSPQEVFDFVQDLTNLKELLPQDKISDWSGEVDRCSFKVAGAYTIGLKKSSVEAPNRIVLESEAPSPVKFDLNIAIAETENGTRAGMVSNLDVNPFMKMMVEKPLRNLFDYIADRLQEKFN